MSSPGLSLVDLDRVAEQFGVSETQVRRDHAISLILDGLSVHHRGEVLFFGGTALSRTYLDAERLSEDIDLIALAPRAEILHRLQRTVERSVQRTYGAVSWQPGFSDNDVQPAVAVLAAGISIKLQLLHREGYEPWPVAEQPVKQRYNGLPEAVLLIPTLASFAGWKTAAWLDRRAPRDLYDLWAMSRLDALDTDAAELFARHGPTGGLPQPWMFDTPPDEQAWRSQLAGQTRLTVTARQALNDVRQAWANTTGHAADDDGHA